MSVTYDGIFIDGQKATFHPEDILTGDASAYTEEIGESVTAWLDENVTSGETLVVDNTLTISGAAADAKVTGDEIGALKEDLRSQILQSETLYDGGKLLKNFLDFSNGYWNTSGVLVDSVTTQHTEKINVTAGEQIYVRFNGFTKIIMRNFNSDGTVASSSELTASGVFTPATAIIAFNAIVGTNRGRAELYLNTNNLASLTNAVESISESVISTNKMNPAITAGGYVRLDGTTGYNSPYSYAQKIPVIEGDTVILVSNGMTVQPMRFVTAYNAQNEADSTLGAQNVTSYTVPSGVTGIIISALTEAISATDARVNFSDHPLPYMDYGASELLTPKYTIDDQELIAEIYQTSANNTDKILNVQNVAGIYKTTEHAGYLTESDGYSGQSGYHSLTTELIGCEAGDVFAYRGVSGRTEGSAVSALFYASGEIVGYSHVSYQKDYSDITIPSGCDSVKFSSYAATGADITLYVYKKNTLAPGRTDYDFLQWKLRPLTTLPDYILNNLSYKPLGQLEHPYICLVTDDGRADMTTRTIPLVLSKGVPMTFAIMSNSEVMQTAEDIAIVKNAITNGGCSVAQHGSRNWTTYSEFALNRYFDEQQAFFDNLEIPVTSAVIPSHYNSKLVFAVAGGRYGVVRSGYNGMNDQGEPVEPTIHYDYYTSGARSNLFGLSSYNVIDKTLAENKQAIEYAIANNKILILYMHETSMTEEYWTLLSDVIDYAKTRPITFINLGDIKTIT